MKKKYQGKTEVKQWGEIKNLKMENSYADRHDE